MDSLTQAVLGAAIGGAVAPPDARRRALVVGALLGTLPDLDVVIDYGGAVENFTYHRGFTHSLFVLAPFAVALWLALRRWWVPVRQAPNRWLAIISLVLITHTLLDAHTAYGTQLFWPLDLPPVMWGTLFIIDPLYTLPLLAGVVVAALRPNSGAGATTLRAALAISTLYIAWSWMAQGMVNSRVQASLADRALADAPVFLVPTPFNTLLWRVVVMTDDGYLEGFHSLLVDEGPIRFDAYPSDQQALDDAADIWAVSRLRWFSQDFLGVRIVDDRLILDDLRMGTEPTYVFTHVVAEFSNGRWVAVPSELIPQSFDRSAFADTWDRLWNGGENTRGSEESKGTE